jgi:NACHT domain
MLAKLKLSDLQSGSSLPGCMKGTRQDILDRIKNWTTDFDAPNILWLKGHPGVGKSAIATSIVEQLRGAERLGSCFFFQRQQVTVMTTQALWRTVAYDLGRQYPTIRKYLLAALKADEAIPDIVDVDKLFRQLIQGPIMASEELPTQRSPVVVIDALDECGGLDGKHSDARRGLLRTLKCCSSLPRRFKLVVTSRAENDIERVISTTNHIPIEILAGQNVDDQSSGDIQTFLTHEFQQIAAGYPRSLAPSWPGPQTIKQLSSNAAGLFNWAKTVIKFISLGDPQSRLSRVLEGGGTGDMVMLYEEILATSFPDPTKDDIIKFRSVVGTIVLAKAPLSFRSLTQLISMDSSAVEHICNGLQSVLDSREFLQFYHQSFVDFLIDPGTSTSKFLIRREEESSNLTLACLRTMKENLRFNICGLKSSYLRNSDVPGLDSLVEQYIPPHLSYSSRFWASHLAETAFEMKIFDYLRYFMQNQFLYWLEVLSVTRLVNLASGMLRILADWIRVRFSHSDAVLTSKSLT